MPDLVPVARDVRPGPLARARAHLGGRVRERIRNLLRDPELDALIAGLEHTSLNEYGYDEFGYNPDVLRDALPVVRWIHRYYFRTEVFGIENVPESGPVLLISNHSGQLPWDGMVLTSSLLFDGQPPRVPRGMVERFVPRLPWVSVLFSRCGQMVGSPENCVRLLEAGEAVMVFPEGARGISKPPSEAYRLTEFGMGFMRLAIATGTPIVPVAIIGAEEQYIRLFDAKPLARLLDLPAVPVFLLGAAPVPGGLLPLPARYRIHFGPAMRFEGDPDDEDAVTGKKVKEVKSAIQRMIHTGLAQRQHVFW